MESSAGAPPAPPDPARLRLLRRTPAAELKVGGLELAEGEGLLWLDLTGPSEADLAWLGRRFGFHPLALEDCAHLDQRPKLEEYADHLFMVQHAFLASGDDFDLSIREVHAFLGKDFLVTVHDAPVAALDQVLERIRSDPAIAGRGPDFWLYLLTDRITDAHFGLLDELAEAIEALEDDILSKPSRRSIERIFALKRTLVLLRKIISPTRDVLAALCKRGDPRVGERAALYFRDVYDHLVRVTEAIEADRDLLGNALDAYLSMAANRTNDIVKQLTIFSVIFLPLTFITGFFGQNFTTLIPYEQQWLLELMLLLCGATPAAMLLWFRSKSWF